MRNRLIQINLVMTVFVFIYSYWLTTESTWRPDHITRSDLGSAFYFWSQARSLVRGQLSVQTPPQWWIECFTIGEKCYGYFGVTPSILRIPAVAIFRDSVVGLVPLFVAIAVTLAFWAAMDLVRLVIVNYQTRQESVSQNLLIRWLVVTGLLLGPGSVLIFTAKARVYEEAVIWCVAFMVLTLNFIYRWSKNHSDRLLGAALLTGTLSALSRPSAIPALVVLGFAVLFIAWRTGRISTKILGAALMVVPAGLYVFIFVSKFGSLSFPWKNYSPYIVSLKGNFNEDSFRQVIENNNGGTVGLRYIPTTLANYFRFDSISFDLGSPWVTLKSIFASDLIILPPVNANQIWGSRIPSLTNTMPIPLLFTAIAIISQLRLVLKRKLKGGDWMPAFMLLAGLAGGVPLIMYYALAGRYLGDLYPLLTVGTAFALPTVLVYSQKDKWWSRAIFPVVALIAVASSFITYQIQSVVF